MAAASVPGMELPATVYALGFSLRKRPLLRRFLPECAVRIAASIDVVPPDAAVVVWGSGDSALVGSRPGVLRVEDGFLRSVGLGADLVAPLSWTVDATGIYYDPGRPSDLERLLQCREFDGDTLARAASLRAAVVAAGLSKYNVGGQVWRRPSTARRVILVPGQVERDESIRLGAPDIKRNVDLLRAVRTACPDAYLVYKPHPDVVSGLRRAGARESRASEWCDETVEDADIGEMLNQVDEVHTMTSLTGFEALLRQRHVVIYGQPFYAGWGLTEDKLPIPRRTRKLTLDELVAGALLLYPRYLSGGTGKLVAAEDVVTELLAWRSRRGRGRSIKSVVQAPMRQLLRWAGDR
jgi:capsular polysaccharide export protein